MAGIFAANQGIPDDMYIGFRDHEFEEAKPLQKQLDAIQTFFKNKHTLFAGSLACGKTDTLAILAAHQLVTYPRNEILIGRKTVDSFTKSTLRNLLNLLPPIMIKRHNHQEHFIEMHPEYGGSIVFYPQLDASHDAVQKIKSMNLGAAFFDQIEEIDEEVFTAVTGQLRRKRASRKTFATCNPNGHDWVWEKWVKNHGRSNYEEGLGFVEARTWHKGVPAPMSQNDVHAGTTDNPTLTFDFIRDMLQRPKNWVNRFVHCDWDNFQGLIWHMARRDMHSVRPFKIPEHWHKFRVIDHGHTNPTAVLWGAVNEKGVLFLYDAHYEAGQWIDYHATIIQNKSGTDYFRRSLADPSMFHVRERHSIAAQYADLGLYWEEADNDKTGGGLDTVGRWWQDGRIRVFDLPCFDPFWDEITGYHWKDVKLGAQSAVNDPEEAAKKNDHNCDALRYLINELETTPPRVKAMYSDDEDYYEMGLHNSERGWMGT